MAANKNLFCSSRFWELRTLCKSKEKYRNSNSRRSISGKLHPVGVAARVALGFMRRSEV